MEPPARAAAWEPDWEQTDAGAAAVSMAAPASTPSPASPDPTASQSAAAPTPVPDVPPAPPHAIREAQSLLAELGYRPGPVDGLWGDGTETAYLAFLDDVDLPAAETLTPQALRAMRAAAKRRNADAGSSEEAPSNASDEIAPQSATLLPPDLPRAAKAGDVDGDWQRMLLYCDFLVEPGQGDVRCSYAACALFAPEPRRRLSQAGLRLRPPFITRCLPLLSPVGFGRSRRRVRRQRFAKNLLRPRPPSGFRKELLVHLHGFGDGSDVQVSDECLDIAPVGFPRGFQLHRQDVLRRCAGDRQVGRVVYRACPSVRRLRHRARRLLVQPGPRESSLASDFLHRFDERTVARIDSRIHVVRGSAAVERRGSWRPRRRCRPVHVRCAAPVVPRGRQAGRSTPPGQGSHSWTSPPLRSRSFGSGSAP